MFDKFRPLKKKEKKKEDNVSLLLNENEFFLQAYFIILVGLTQNTQARPIIKRNTLHCPIYGLIGLCSLILKRNIDKKKGINKLGLYVLKIKNGKSILDL